MPQFVPPFASRVPFLAGGHPLLRGQVGWWLSREGAGTKVANIAKSAYNEGALQSGVTWGKSAAGLTPSFDGTSTSYINVGANLISSTDSITFSWLEEVDPTTPSFAGVCCFFPTGGSQRFMMFREGASYGRLACAVGNSAAMVIWSTIPTINSGIRITRHFVVRGRNGVTSTTPGDWDAWCDGIKYTASAGPSISSQTSQLNYLGWDGADSKWKGNQSNQRLWNRALSDGEIASLLENPYAGIAGEDLVMSGSSAAASANSMLLAF